MKKVAYLVDVSFRTRVVVEVPNNFNPYGEELPQEAYDSLLAQTNEHLIDKINNDEVNDNLEEYYPDDECPYGTLDSDKEEPNTKLIGVEWDTDTEEEANELPATVRIPEDMDDENVCEYLSDEYGFCVKSWWDILEY